MEEHRRRDLSFNLPLIYSRRGDHDGESCPASRAEASGSARQSTCVANPIATEAAIAGDAWGVVGGLALRVGGGHGSAGRPIPEGAGLLQFLQETFAVPLRPFDDRSFKMGAAVLWPLCQVSVPQG